MHKNQKVSKIFIHIILVISLIITLYPFLFMITTSLKSNAQFFSNLVGITFPFHFENYVQAWDKMGKYLLNSVFISGVTVVAVLFFSSLSAYAFARFKFKGKEFLFLTILALLMIPSGLTLVPQFLISKKILHLYNNYAALLLPYLAFYQPVAIFIMRSFIENLGEELFEAARIDGAKEIYVYRKIALPLILPIFTTVGILTFINVWNEFTWALVILTSDKFKTISFGIYTFVQQYNQKTIYGAIFAGFTLAALPVFLIYVFAMKSFVEGLTAGAIKA